MPAISPEIGWTYYRITFADADQTMPSVQPMVFVGVNILESDKGSSIDTFYFQDTVSVVRFGLAGSPDESSDSTNGDCRVFTFGPDEIGVSIVDLDGVGKVIESASIRAQTLGQPRLKKASGKWR